MQYILGTVLGGRDLKTAFEIARSHILIKKKGLKTDKYSIFLMRAIIRNMKESEMVSNKLKRGHRAGEKHLAL